MENFKRTFAEELEDLIQQALDNKNSADDGEKARKWAIVRTELEQIHSFVLVHLSISED